MNGTTGQMLAKQMANFWKRCVEGPRERPLLLPKVNTCLSREPETEADTLALVRASHKRMKRAHRNLALRRTA